MTTHNNPYAFCGDNVYHCGKLIKGCSKATFKNLGDGYSSDNKNIYYDNKSIASNSSFDDFENIEDGYAKTLSCVYYKGKKIPGVLSITFDNLGNGYAHDQCATYYEGVSMKTKLGDLTIPPLPEKTKSIESDKPDEPNEPNEPTEHTESNDNTTTEDTNSRKGHMLTLRCKGNFDLSGKSIYVP
jgi:hypothetical protein